MCEIFRSRNTGTTTARGIKMLISENDVGKMVMKLGR